MPEAKSLPIRRFRLEPRRKEVARMNEMNSKHVCPWCGCADTHKSHRRGFIDRGLVRFLRISPFRCEDCYRRFYAREVGRSGAASGRVAVG